MQRSDAASMRHKGPDAREAPVQTMRNGREFDMLGAWLSGWWQSEMVHIHEDTGCALWGLPLSNIMLGKRSVHAIEYCGSSSTLIADWYPLCGASGLATSPREVGMCPLPGLVPEMGM